MPPDPPRTLAPAARAKNAFGISFSPPLPIAKMLRGPCKCVKNCREAKDGKAYKLTSRSLCRIRLCTVFLIIRIGSAPQALKNNMRELDQCNYPCHGLHTCQCLRTEQLQK